MKRLQTIQNTLACKVMKTPKHHHITPVLKSLNWLKVPQDIHYKIVSLTYLRVQYSENLSTLLHSPTTHHPTARVYSLIVISFFISLFSLILSQVLQTLPSKIAGAVYTLHQLFGTESQKTSVSLLILLIHLLFQLSSACTLPCYTPLTT